MFKIAVLVILPVMFILTSLPEPERSHSLQTILKLSKLTTFENAHKGTFAPDAKLLAVVGDNYVDIVETPSNRRLMRIAPDKATLLGAKFSPDGRSLAIAYKVIENSLTNNFKIALWDVSTGKEKLELPFATDQWYRAIDDLSFSKDSELLASNLGGIARLWKISDGTEFRRFLPPVNNPNIQSERVLLSPDGMRLAIYFKRENPAIDVIRIWDLSTQKTLDLHTNIYRDWEFSPNSDLLAITSIRQKGRPDEHSAVEIWDVKMGKLIRTINVPNNWRGAFVVSFSPDASIVAIGGYKKFGVFSAQTGTLLAEAEHPGSRPFADNELGNELSDIEFSPDGKTILTGGYDSTVKLWRFDK